MIRADQPGRGCTGPPWVLWNLGLKAVCLMASSLPPKPFATLTFPHNGLSYENISTVWWLEFSTGTQETWGSNPHSDMKLVDLGSVTTSLPDLLLGALVVMKRGGKNHVRCLEHWEKIMQIMQHIKMNKVSMQNRYNKRHSSNRDGWVMRNVHLSMKWLFPIRQQ